MLKHFLLLLGLVLGLVFLSCDEGTLSSPREKKKEKNEDIKIEVVYVKDVKNDQNDQKKNRQSYNYSMCVSPTSNFSSWHGGFFCGTNIFGAGEENETTITTAATLCAGFIAQFAANGKLEVVKKIDTDSKASVYDIAATVDGGCIAVGYCLSAVFGPGETILESKGFFVARFDINGALVWVRGATGTGEITARSVTITEDVIWVVGTAKTAGAILDSTVLGSGLLVAKYDSSGRLLQADTYENLSGVGVVSTPDSECIVTGTITGPARIGESALDYFGGDSTFLARFNTEGAPTWVRQVYYPFPDGYVRPISLALNESDIFLAGEFTQQPVFGQGEDAETRLNSGGSRVTFFARYTDAGALLWAKQTKSSGTIYRPRIALTTDATGTTTGFFMIVHIMDHVTFGETLIERGGDDYPAFFGKFTPDGQLIKHEIIHTEPVPTGGITVTAFKARAGRVFFSGGFRGRTVFQANGKEKVLNSTKDSIFIASYEEIKETKE